MTFCASVNVIEHVGATPVLADVEADTLTLDPKNRTLLQVQLEDALKADEMFRVLMGEKVEPRREFIQKHALEVKDIDYHGA